MTAIVNKWAPPASQPSVSLRHHTGELSNNQIFCTRYDLYVDSKNKYHHRPKGCDLRTEVSDSRQRQSNSLTVYLYIDQSRLSAT